VESKELIDMSKPSEKETEEIYCWSCFTHQPHIFYEHEIEEDTYTDWWECTACNKLNGTTCFHPKYD